MSEVHTDGAEPQPRGEAKPAPSREESERRTQKFLQNAEALYAEALALYEDDVWRGLGFVSWGDYWEKRIGRERTNGYRMVAAGRDLIELQASCPRATLPALDGFTERKGRPLRNLTTDQKVRAVQIVQRRCRTIGQAAVRDMEQARDEARGAPPQRVQAELVRGTSATHRPRSTTAAPHLRSMIKNAQACLKRDLERELRDLTEGDRRALLHEFAAVEKVVAIVRGERKVVEHPGHDRARKTRRPRKRTKKYEETRVPGQLNNPGEDGPQAA
jgi:hypothetical protein